MIGMTEGLASRSLLGGITGVRRLGELIGCSMGEVESGEMFGGVGVAALICPRKYHSAVLGKVTTLEPQPESCLGEVSGHGSTLAED